MTDHLFHLGWLLENPDFARRGLDELARKAEHYPDTEGISELDTQAIFVEPLLRGLGWETLDHNQVDRAPTGNYPDIELWAKDRQCTPKRVVIIEVKPWRQSDKHGWQHQRVGRTRSPYMQLKGYALECLTRLDSVAASDDEPIFLGAVTNGGRWVVYEFDRNVVRFGPLQHTPVCEFEIRSLNPQGLVYCLGRNVVLKRFGLL